MERLSRRNRFSRSNERTLANSAAAAALGPTSAAAAAAAAACSRRRCVDENENEFALRAGRDSDSGIRLGRDSDVTRTRLGRDSDTRRERAPGIGSITVVGVRPAVCVCVCVCVRARGLSALARALVSNRWARGTAALKSAEISRNQPKSAEISAVRVLAVLRSRPDSRYAALSGVRASRAPSNSAGIGAIRIRGGLACVRAG